MSHLLLSIGLYAFGPFFSNPLKPVINAYAGTSYELGYKHFWAGHKTPFNLTWHVICLFFQVFSNFSFLASLDGLLQPYTGTNHLLTTSTALCWIGFLMVPKCPLIVKINSILWILAAHIFASSIPPNYIEYISYFMFLLVWVIFVLQRGLKSYKGAPLIVVSLVGKVTVCHLLKNQYTGVLAEKTGPLVMAYMLGLVLLSMLKDPVKAVVAYGAVGAPILALLLASPHLHLFGFAYVATALQGLAHSVSGEEATLLALQSEDNDAEKLSFEWGHVTFFPNLLGHACYDCFVGTKRKARVARVPPAARTAGTKASAD